MKTIKEWLELLPEPYRSKALRNADPHWIHDIQETAADALGNAFIWNRSPEKSDYWMWLHEHLLRGTLSLEAGKPEEGTHKQTQNTQTMLEKYSAQAVSTVTLVYGTDVTDLSAKQCLSAIKSNNDEIKTLRESGVQGPYIDQQIADRQAANAALTVQLNSFARPVAAPAAS